MVVFRVVKRCCLAEVYWLAVDVSEEPAASIMGTMIRLPDDGGSRQVNEHTAQHSLTTRIFILAS